MELEPKPQSCSTFYAGADEGIPIDSAVSQTLGTWARRANRDGVGEDHRTKLRHTYGWPRAPPRDRQWRTHTRSPPGRSRPEGGPLKAGGAGRLRLAMPLVASLSVWAEPGGLRYAYTSAPSGLIHIYEPVGAGPGSPSVPRPRPGIPPRRRLKSQRGAPGFRFGEGVSTWSRLKNVSRPLLPAPGCVCGVSSMRGKEQRGKGKDCSSPLGKDRENAG